MKTSDHLSLTGERSFTLDIPEGREGAADVKIKATQSLGSGRLSILASGGNKSAKSSIELSVRPAVPHQVSLLAGLMDKSSLELSLSRTLFPEFRKQHISVSAAPVSLAWGLIQFLDEFPYGCTEQLVSKGVPSMILRGRSEFAQFQKKAQETFKATIAVLQSRQTPRGGFALYNPMRETEIPHVSLYAIHYLIEAQARGFAVPPDLMARSLDYLKSSQLRRTDSISLTRLFAHSLYLQARMGLVPSHDVNFLKQALEKNHKGNWERDLTAIYLAGTYKLLKQDDEGDSLLKKLKIGEIQFQDYDYLQDNLVRDAGLVYVVAKHAPQLLSRLIDADSLKPFIKPITAGQYNTYSSAHVIMALDALIDSAGKTNLLKDLKLEEFDSGGKVSSLNIPTNFAPRIDLSGQAHKVKISKAVDSPLFYGLVQSGFDKSLPTKELRQKIELQRDYKFGGKSVSKVKLGDEVEVVLRLRTLENFTVRNLAMVDLLPGGFEIVLDSHSTPEPSASNPSLHNVNDEADAPENMDNPPQEAEDGVQINWQKLLFGNTAFAQTRSTSVSRLTTDYVDYREDRVVVYGSAGPDVQEFTYKIKAVNRGSFTVPPPFAESMYDRSIQYRGVSGKIEIE